MYSFLKLAERSAHQIDLLCSTQACVAELKKDVFRNQLVAWLDNIRDFVVTADYTWNEPQISLSQKYLKFEFPIHNGTQIELLFYSQLNFRGTLSFYRGSELVIEYSRSKMSNQDLETFFQAYSAGRDAADLSRFFRTEPVSEASLETYRSIPRDEAMLRPEELS